MEPEIAFRWEMKMLLHVARSRMIYVRQALTASVTLFEILSTWTAFEYVNIGNLFIWVFAICLIAARSK